MKALENKTYQIYEHLEVPAEWPLATHLPKGALRFVFRPAEARAAKTRSKSRRRTFTSLPTGLNVEGAEAGRFLLDSMALLDSAPWPEEGVHSTDARDLAVKVVQRLQRILVALASLQREKHRAKLLGLRRSESISSFRYLRAALQTHFTSTAKSLADAADAQLPSGPGDEVTKQLD